MRFALISDLHSHAVALDAVLEDISGRGVDEVLCLGDIVDLGPQPQEVVDRLRALEIRCIEGNHDPLDEGPDLPLLAAIEQWTIERLTDDARAWLADLPSHLEVDLGGARMLCVHGSPRSFNESILADTSDQALGEMLDGVDCKVVACGHTHVQLLRHLGSRTLVNAGSASMPFEQAYDGSSTPRVLPWAEYAIVEAVRGRVHTELLQVDYDFGAYRRAVHDSGMPSPEQWLSQWVDPQGPDTA